MSDFEKRKESLVLLAKEKGYELSFGNIDGNHLNCLWNGGDKAFLKKNDLTLVISAIGDIRVDLLNENGEVIETSADKTNSGGFFADMHRYISGDAELEKLISEDRLVFRENNWWEVDGIVGSKFIDLGFFTDNVLDDNLFDAINEVVDDIDSWEETVRHFNSI